MNTGEAVPQNDEKYFGIKSWLTSRTPSPREPRMRRLTLLLVAAATARPENATAYFDAASRLWPPTTAAGRCLAAQRKHGWRPKPHGSNFKTLGTEGVGHHLCGNQISDAPP